MKEKYIKILGKLPRLIDSKIRNNVNVVNDRCVLGFFIDYSQSTIKLDAVFTSVEYNGVVSELFECQLIHVTNQFLMSFDHIEYGFKSICYFKLKDADLDKFDMVKVIEGWQPVDEKIILKM